jgi:hypothetical protein
LHKVCKFSGVPFRFLDCQSFHGSLDLFLHQVQLLQRRFQLLWQGGDHFINILRAQIAVASNFKSMLFSPDFFILFAYFLQGA